MLGSSEEARAPDFLIEAAYASRAHLAVIPLQDLLGLDSAGRMNVPGKADGNWRWRFKWADLTPTIAARAFQRAQRHARLA
jgi:4-alpha-glucanotransferase